MHYNNKVTIFSETNYYNDELKKINYLNCTKYNFCKSRKNYWKTYTGSTSSFLDRNET